MTIENTKTVKCCKCGSDFETKVTKSKRNKMQYHKCGLCTNMSKAFDMANRLFS